MFGCKKQETEPASQTKTSVPTENPQTKTPKKETVFGWVTLLNQECVVGKKIEFDLFEEVDTILEKYNPFDYNQIKVAIEFTSPSGEKQEVTAFWCQDSNIILNTYGSYSISGINGVASTDPNEVQGMELVNPIGDPRYRVRFTPKESGEYSYIVKVYFGNTLTSEEHPGKFTVSESTEPYKGVIKVDELNHTFFKFSETNETFMGVGQNACWYTSSTRKTEDYRVWFEYFKENNMNLTRIWMALWGFSLHYDSYNNFSKRSQQAARLDKMLELAEENGVYLSLCMIDHGQFSSTVNSRWNENPYNVARGGILTEPYQFFTSEQAKEAYKNELMYIISRYGYSNHILCFELFNEVDWCDNYSLITPRYKEWHKEMAAFIKENDSYHHLVSTSFRGTDGAANSLEDIDFVMPHDYSYTSKKMYENAGKVLTQLIDKYNKPAFFGEIGLSSSNGDENRNMDGSGVSIHQGQWVGIMAGSGASMNWWWDSYVHPNKLYYRFKGAGAFAKLMDLTGADYRRLQSLDYTISNDNLRLIGHCFNDRMYGYLYDNSWTYYNNSIITKDNITISIPFANGTFMLEFYDTGTGELLTQQAVEAKNGMLTFKISSIQYDCAFIVK